MKKLVLTFAVVFATITVANAQLFVGGNLGVGFTGASKTVTDDGTTTVTVDPVKILNFNITPRIGYNLNDKMAVGLDLRFGMTNYTYPDNYYGWGEKDHKDVSTDFGAALFFRYYLMEIGQLSLFAEANAGLLMGNGKEEYTTTLGATTTTTTINDPKTTDIFVGITPGISYKVNDHLQFDAYLGLLQLGFLHSISKTETTNLAGTTTTTTVSDNQFNFGLNQHNRGNLFKIGVVYNF